MLDFVNSPYLSGILTLLVAHLFCMVVPGPDFALVVRNSLLHSRRAGILTAVGISLGMCFHVSYSLVGIGILIQKSTWGFSIVKFLGAGYLIYIGVQALRTKNESLKELTSSSTSQSSLSAFQAVRGGFLTNALNPLAMMFFLTMFAMLITTSTPQPVKLFYVAQVFAEAVLWFGLVALCFSQPQIRSLFLRLGHWLGRITGGVLLFFGVKLAFMLNP